MNEVELEQEELENKNIDPDESYLDDLFICYDYLEKLKTNSIDKTKVLNKFNEFLKDYSTYVKSLDLEEDYYNKFNLYVEEKQNTLNSMIEGNKSNDELITELTCILEFVSNFEELNENNYANDLETTNESKETELSTEEIDVSTEENIQTNLDSYNTDVISNDKFQIKSIDEMYEKLYDAIVNKDIKKESKYRGRLIRLLKKNQDLIDEKYNEVECLVQINEILNNDFLNSYEEITKILNKKENDKFKYYLEKYLNNLETFKNKFNDICEKYDVKKKKMYKESLEIEIKEQERVLNERYDREFLEKKAGLTSIVTTLPKAVGLQIQKVANSIDALKVAKTNRKKVQEAKEVLKEMGMAIATPVIYAGKFATSNWYAMYALTKGYSNVKSATISQENVSPSTISALGNNSPTIKKQNIQPVSPSTISALGSNTSGFKQQEPNTPPVFGPKIFSKEELERKQYENNVVGPKKFDKANYEKQEPKVLPALGGNTSTTKTPSTDNRIVYGPQIAPKPVYGPRPYEEIEPVEELEPVKENEEIIYDPSKEWNDLNFFDPSKQKTYIFGPCGFSFMLY